MKTKAMLDTKDKKDSGLIKSAGCITKNKFALKHINSLLCGSYLFTVIVTIFLIIYIHNVNNKNLKQLLESREFPFRILDEEYAIYSADSHER